MSSTTFEQASAPRAPYPLRYTAKRVLIVEDERIIARDIANTLEDLGYDVLGIADCADEAIQIAAELTPDIILMDIRIRGQRDGIETATVIRSQQDVAVVFLSANADARTLGRALESTPGGYLAKPYDARSLHATMEVALSRHDAEMALRRENALIRAQEQVAAHRAQSLERVAERLRRDSMLDALTGLSNRRQFEAALARELAAAERKMESVGLVLLDIDHFKRINDRHGHSAGDAVLRQLAGVIRAELRVYDEPCRFGGEEFAVVVPGASADASVIVAERLRAAIEAFDFRDDDRPLAAVTVSVGVAAFPAHSRADLVRVADSALYEAKHAGRNRVVSAPSLPTVAK